MPRYCRRCRCGCSPFRSGLYWQQAAGGSLDPIGRSSLTYTHKRPVLVLPRPGFSTGTRVSFAWISAASQGVAPQRCHQGGPATDRLDLPSQPAWSGPAQRRGGHRYTSLTIQGQVVAILGDQHMSQQAGTGHATRNRVVQCARLEDRLARHTDQLGPHMPDHLEVRRQVLKLLGHVLPDSAQPGTARRAAAGLTRTVVLTVADLGQVFLDIARQMCRTNSGRSCVSLTGACVDASLDRETMATSPPLIEGICAAHCSPELPNSTRTRRSSCNLS